MVLQRNSASEPVLLSQIKLLDALRLSRNLVVLLGPLLVTKELFIHLRSTKTREISETLTGEANAHANRARDRGASSLTHDFQHLEAKDNR